MSHVFPTCSMIEVERWPFYKEIELGSSLSAAVAYFMYCNSDKELSYKADLIVRPPRVEFPFELY